MRKILICLIFPVLFIHCKRQTNQNDSLHREGRIKYLEYNLGSSLKHSGAIVKNINLINRFDTVAVAELFSGKDKLLFIHLSGLYCSDCNRKILIEVKRKLKAIPESGIVVFGTNMSQREALVSYGDNIYVSKENLSNNESDFNYPYLSIVNSTLRQELFFIPDVNYKNYLDSCITIIETKLITNR